MSSIEANADCVPAFERDLTPTQEQIVRLHALMDFDGERLRELREEQEFIELRLGLHLLLAHGAEEPGSIALYKLDFDRQNKLILWGGRARVALQSSPNFDDDGEIAALHVPVVGKFIYEEVPRAHQTEGFGSTMHYHEAQGSTDIVDFGAIDELRWLGAESTQFGIETHHMTFLYGETPYIMTGIPLPISEIRSFIEDNQTDVSK